MVATVNKREK